MTATTRKWLHGLIGGFVGGAAGAIDSSLALMVLVPEKFNLGPGLKQTLETAAVLGLLTGLKCSFAYLKQSPIPPEDATNGNNATMNKIVSVLVLTAALALAGCVTGCSTVTHTLADGSTVTNNVPDPLVLRVATQEAASVGTTLYLQQRPQDRPQFELARKSLRGLVAAGSGSVADLQAALAGLPVQQLQGSNGVIIVDSAVVIINAARQQLAKLDSKQIWSDYVQPIAQGLLDGLDQALGPQSSLESKCPGGLAWNTPVLDSKSIITDLVYRGPVVWSPAILPYPVK